MEYFDFFTFKYRSTKTKYNTRDKMDSKLADENINYCKKCNRCWEINAKNDRSKQKEFYIKYYIDFPRYGKKKKTCKWCKE
jgi:hypothetical protein